MNFLIGIVLLAVFSGNDSWKIDFGQQRDGAHWRVLNDGVMGGLSQSTLELKAGSALFRGQVSLENNGGFASLRSPFQSYDLSGYQRVTIRYRGKGQSFGLTFEQDRRFYIPYYKKVFTPKTGDWEVVTMNLSEFEAYRVGRPIGRYFAAEERADVIRIGVITNDKQVGPFELEIDYILFE